VLKFKYFLLEINKVTTNININKIEIIKITEIGKYQSMLKKFVTKKYEKIIENIKEKIIMGKNNIKVSSIISLKIFNFSKPRILKTRF
tara:strand:+ start:309 stop:572 length:264 start_codon:yes stop_codon:yes gene_type:complete